MENSNLCLDDISGPPRTEQTGDFGSSVPNPPKMSTAPFTVGAESQVMKRLICSIYILQLHFISDSIYVDYFLKSRAALKKLKVLRLPEILTKVNGIANVHPVIRSPSSHHILNSIKCLKTQSNRFLQAARSGWPGLSLHWLLWLLKARVMSQRRRTWNYREPSM